MIKTIDFNSNLTCCHRQQLISVTEMISFDLIESVLLDAIQRCLTLGNESECSHSSLFHCKQSLKCLSYDRVVDGYQDCYFNEDETYPSCHFNQSKRFQCPSNSSLCLSLVAIENNSPDCPQGEDDKSVYERLSDDYPTFRRLCPYKTGIRYESVEDTQCHLWPCDNVYSRCNGYWQCQNGIDELNCPLNSCGFNQHECLSIAYLFESFVDRCYSNSSYLIRRVFYDNRTDIDHHEYLSWNQTKCITADKICRKDFSSDETVCLVNDDSMYIDYEIEVRTNDGIYQCDQIDVTTNIPSGPIIHGLLKSSRFGYFPPVATNRPVERIHPADQMNFNELKMNLSDSLSCHRGIRIGYRSNRTRKCLCPPSYFGSECQWQNQRISLTVQFVHRSTTSNSSIFQIVVMLIDDRSEEITESFQQIEFIPIRDCQTKFNIYLLYPQRPKRVPANYSIRIDIFNKIQLEYYGSSHLSINYSFLPVNRLSTLLFIPELVERKLCDLSCGEHGQCVEYLNRPWLNFCRCQQGYEGRFCNMTSQCSCSNGSLCLSSSICICPMNRFGRRCYLNHSICRSSMNRCENRGICVPNDPRISLTKWTCLCQQGFYGQFCEINQTRIDIRFDKNLLNEASSMLIHLIAAFDNRNYERTTILKRIRYPTNAMSFYVQQQFHLAFVELSSHMYYLIVRRQVFIESETIEVELESNQICPFLNVFLNETIVNSTQKDRMKVYPWICREYSQLTCFYDNRSMCICDLDRFSNCFQFNHSKSYDCQGQNDCLNGGECFENNQTCPNVRLCHCKKCFYGSRCQFSSEGFLLSLDPLLVYQIRPFVPIHQQSRFIDICSSNNWYSLFQILDFAFVSIDVDNESIISAIELFACGWIDENMSHHKSMVEWMRFFRTNDGCSPRNSI